MKKHFILSFLLTLALFAVPASAAELYDNMSEWNVSASSQMGSSIQYAFDGEADKLWHTAYKAEGGQITERDMPPHTVDIVFPKALDVGGIRYVPRQLNQGDSTSGIWKKAIFYGSTDGKSFKEIGSATYPADLIETRATVDTKVADGTYKAIRIKITDSKDNFATAAEIGIIKKGTITGEVGKSDVTAEQKPVATVSNVEAYPSTGWSVKASSQMQSNTIENAFTDETKWIWHSAYKVEGGQIVSHDELPITVDINFPSKLKVGGIRYLPRQLELDNSTIGIWKKTVFYGSEDGKNFREIGRGTYPDDLGYTRKAIDMPVTEGEYIAIRIEVTDAAGGYASASQIKVLGYGVGEAVTAPAGGASDSAGDSANKTPLQNKEKWEIVASSARGTSEKNLIDNNKATNWHSNYQDKDGVVTSSDKPPFTIDVTFPEDVVISGFSLLPRQSDVSGRISNAELYIAETVDGDWIKIKDLEFSGSASEAVFNFLSNIKVRRARLNVTASRNNVAAAAEINFLPENEKLETLKPDEFIAYEEANMLYKVDRSNFSIEENCVHWSSNDPKNLLDDTTATYWQTETGEKAPWILTVDMQKVYTLSAFSFTPRQTEDFHGVWLNFEVEVSTDGKNFEFVTSDSTQEKNLETKTYKFDKDVKARYVRFIILDGYTGRASASDISFYQTKDAYEADKYATMEKYVLKVDNNSIEVEKGEKSYVKTLDTAPFIDPASSSTLIPLRGLLEEMGATVEWEDSTQTVTVVTATGKIVMQIRNNLVYTEHPTYGNVRYTLRVAPEIKDSRTFIPLRFVSEQLGYNVAWDGETRTITITK